MENSEKKENTHKEEPKKVSWFIPWLAGYIFTVYYYGGANSIIPLTGKYDNICMEVVRSFVIFVLWPAYLGLKMGRH